MIKNNLVYRGVKKGKQQEECEQLVLPSSYRTPVLETAHQIPMAGHMGRKKTLSRILRRFFWPGVYNEVAELCRRCPECQRVARHQHCKSPLMPLPVVGKPFEKIAMDLVGPLPRSKAGYRYLLVIMDYCTRYPEAIPLKKIDSSVDALMGVFSRVGFPNEILTDCGANFVSKVMQDFYQLLKIKSIKTSPYHPQTDGMVERFNSTLKSMLRKVMQKFDNQWDKAVPYLLFAYREVPNETTGYSSFEMIYGRPVRGPLDLLKETWEDKTAEPESVIAYVQKIQQRLNEVHKLAGQHEKKAKSDMKLWYDKAARARSFTVGEQVLVLLPARKKKSY